MTTEIITDGFWHNFYYGCDVPQAVLEDYDWLDDDERAGHWVAIEYGSGDQKRAEYRHLSDFLICQNGGEFDRLGWHGCVSDSAFHGILIRVSRDGEMYKIGKLFN